MNRIYRALLVLGISMTLSCQLSTPQNPQNSTEATLPNAVFSLGDQAYLAQLVRKYGIANKQRSLAHISHTCMLTIDEQTYAVVDMRELVRGATTARGSNQLILLDSKHQLINRIEYGNARPLFCEDNKLYLYGEITLDGQAGAGNVLVFADAGNLVTAIHDDLNARLPLD